MTYIGCNTCIFYFCHFIITGLSQNYTSQNYTSKNYPSQDYTTSLLVAAAWMLTWAVAASASLILHPQWASLSTSHHAAHSGNGRCLACQCQVFHTSIQIIGYFTNCSTQLIQQNLVMMLNGLYDHHQLGETLLPSFAMECLSAPNVAGLTTFTHLVDLGGHDSLSCVLVMWEKGFFLYQSHDLDGFGSSL